jgi:hypothetical protein
LTEITVITYKFSDLLANKSKKTITELHPCPVMIRCRDKSTMNIQKLTDEYTDFGKLNIKMDKIEKSLTLSGYQPWFDMLTKDKTNHIIYGMTGDSSYYDADDPVWLYNIEKNLGFILNFYAGFLISFQIFYLNSNNTNPHYNINGECLELSEGNLKSFSGNYKRLIQRYYYYSADDSCGWRNETDVGTRKYLSSYGTENVLIAKFLEWIARHELNIIKDEEICDQRYDETETDVDYKR